MNRRVTLLFFLVLAAVGGLAWLHFQIVPGIRWSNDATIFYDGWRAILKAWPIWLIASAAGGLLGFLTVGLIGETARERDYKAKATEAEDKAANAEKVAENATNSAEAALENDKLSLQRQQTEAEQQIALAQSERSAAKDDIEQYDERNADLIKTIKNLGKQNRRSVAAQERGKAREQKRKQTVGDPEALAEAKKEIECLKQKIRDDRQYVFKLEQRQPNHS